MAHIHTQSGQHDLTVSAYIVRLDADQPRVLFHMHKNLKQWMQMGGHVELHETPWKALERETREESGYNLDQLSLLQPPHTIADLNGSGVAHPQPFLFATYPYGATTEHFHTDLAFVFVTTQEPRHPIGDHESAQLQWFTRNEIVNLPPEQIVHNVRVAALHIFDRLLGEWQRFDPSLYR